MKIYCGWVTVNPGYDDTASYYATDYTDHYWDWRGDIEQFREQLQIEGYTILNVGVFGDTEYLITVRE
jgi:hypothetical protein